MSTSDRVVLVEAAAAAALVCGAVALVSPDDVWLTELGLHPLWLPVIVMAARYATRGLFVALGVAAAGLLATGAALGQPIETLAAPAGDSAHLLALGAAVLVAWVAMLHQSRLGRAIERLDEATERRSQAERNLDALQGSLGYLRARHDRLDLSLSLWRSLAGRIECGEPEEACRAVLELCEIRAGARAGVVQLRDGMRLGTIACRGPWSSTATRPPDIEGDATVRAAIASRQVTPAPAGSTERDSDVAAPIVDEAADQVIGVIALRGVSPSSLRAADLRDLEILAAWIAPAVGRHLRRRANRTPTELSRHQVPS